MSHFSDVRAALFAAVATLIVLLSAPVASAETIVARDEYSVTKRLDDGRLRSQVSTEPMNYLTEGGVWKKVDASLEPAGNGVVAAASVDGEVKVPASAGGRVRVEHDGREVSLKLVGASGGDREVDEATASFSDVLPGVSTTYTATARGVKEVVKLSSSADHVLEYDLRGPAAWSAVLDGDDVVFKDSEGTIRFRVSAPLAWDSAEDTAYTNALVLAVSKVSDGRWSLTLTPDEDWIQDPARVLPFFIDPDVSWADGTTTIQGTAADTYVASAGQANYSYGHNGHMHTGYHQRTYEPGRF